jgi:hypothetical protein
MVKSGKKWQKVKQKVAKSKAKSGKKWHKWQNSEGKSVKMLQKVVKSGKKC